MFSVISKRGVLSELITNLGYAEDYATAEKLVQLDMEVCLGSGDTEKRIYEIKEVDNYYPADDARFDSIDGELCRNESEYENLRLLTKSLWDTARAVSSDCDAVNFRLTYAKRGDDFPEEFRREMQTMTDELSSDMVKFRTAIENLTKHINEIGEDNVPKVYASYIAQMLEKTKEKYEDSVERVRYIFSIDEPEKKEA